MDELIYKEQALNCFHCWVDKRGDVHEPDEMAEYRAIEALPAVDAEPQWIPVTGRPPKNKQPCLLTIGRGGKLYLDMGIYSTDLYSIDEYDFVGERGKSGWYYRDSGYPEYCEHTGVLAWMSLPEPYSRKEGDRNDNN